MVGNLPYYITSPILRKFFTPQNLLIPTEFPLSPFRKGDCNKEQQYEIV
ncbi:MAG: hypothetical protein LBG59_07160 [Candidatus Peribacteria bacterium]|jgi:hypothetical protein|nr:hypothetical protein [Candidatus Peribacteria bacterium]